MRARKLLSATALTAAALLVGSLAAPPVSAQEVDEISSLRGKRPNLPDLTGIVANQANLRVLGKALFWDSTVGSDGFACASCHFHAGADIRIVNQFNPGPDGAFDSVTGAPDHEVNQEASADQFPFFIPDPNDPRNGTPERDGDDRFSSNGTFAGSFVSGQAVDDGTGTIGDDECTISLEDIHQNFRILDANGDPLATRKVEPRQTPSVVNAVFNFRNFWDGRANNIFNGVDPFGERTNSHGTGGVLRLDANGVAQREILNIRHASLASQAVGPVLSDFEMSCEGRPFAFVGRKILAQTALQSQEVDPRDSVFRASGLIDASGTGLTATYRELVEAAFEPEYWDDDQYYNVTRDPLAANVNDRFNLATSDETDPDAFTLIEQNFPLFWGLALLEYQATLITDASDFDRNRLTASARRGQDVFENKGQCVACHVGPLLSGAAITDEDNNVLIEGMFLASQTGNPFAALYDDSFYNLGVSPTEEDLGVGDTDPYGNPLSFTRQATTGNIADDIILDQNNDGQITIDDGVVVFEDPLLQPELTNADGTFLGQRDAVDGAFKTPILRNVGATPPYMHDGSMSNLDQVIDFYDRGGNRLNVAGGPVGEESDTTGFGPNASNLDADIGVLDLTPGEKEDLKNFLLSLTDSRVLCHRAPFDHPELDIYLGHNNVVGDRGAPRAEDIEPVLPAVGSRGYPRGDCLPNTGDLFGEMQTKLNALLVAQP